MPQDPKKKKVNYAAMAKVAAEVQKITMTYDKDGKPIKKKKPKKRASYKKDKAAYRKEQRKGGPTF